MQTLQRSSSCFKALELARWARHWPKANFGDASRPTTFVRRRTSRATSSGCSDQGQFPRPHSPSRHPDRRSRAAATELETIIENTAPRANGCDHQRFDPAQEAFVQSLEQSADVSAPPPGRRCKCSQNQPRLPTGPSSSNHQNIAGDFVASVQPGRKSTPVAQKSAEVFAARCYGKQC